MLVVGPACVVVEFALPDVGVPSARRKFNVISRARISALHSRDLSRPPLRVAPYGFAAGAVCVCAIRRNGPAAGPPGLLARSFFHRIVANDLARV